jgi:enamine deaminase RidA (YjgF/YER057c/UK114 family)
MVAAGSAPDSPDSRLSELGITLPTAPAPAAAYLPYVIDAGLVWTAGQIAVRDGTPVATGLVGADVDMAMAQTCARQCAVNVLAQLRAAAQGDLARVERLVKLTVFVASAPGFTDQHLVANAASELMAAVFGEAGRHARSAVGVAVLPLGSPVEIEATARLR